MTPSALLQRVFVTAAFTAALLLFLLPGAGVSHAADQPQTSYVIVLASAPGTGLTWKPKKNSLFKGRTLYVTRTTVKGKPWERLNLGFFNSRHKAVLVMNEVEELYPGAWIREVPDDEVRAAAGRALAAPAAKKSAPATGATSANKSSLTDEQLSSLMQRAKDEFKKHNYSQSIRFFNAVISAGEHKYSMEALELLGLSRQRKGQNAHAARIYREYLEKYPDSDGAIRVTQRLNGLMTATQEPREKIHMEEDEAPASRTSVIGSFSQFYRKDRTETDDIDGSITTLSQLITFLDLTALYQTARFDQRFQFTADDTYDFLEDGEGNSFRFIETYYDLSSRATGTSGRIGRQALRLGGILRRFDGISAGYQITPGMRLNILGGYPVGIDNKTSINQHRSFYGVTFETGTFLQYWDLNLFYFDQEVDGLDDVSNVGTEIRYNDRTKSLFGMIDYNLDFEDINILQFNANLLFDRGRTAYLNAFMRKTPVLATSNALIGRTEETIEQLKEVLSIEQIYQLALDRTADSATITVGGSQPISEKFQANADITFSKVEGTEASGGVPATPSTGTDYFISAQVVGNNLILRRDTGVLGVRYLDTRASTTWSLIANTRIPISRNWRLNPRLQYDIRDFSDGRDQNKLRALIRTDYRYLNKIRFDFEIGYDNTSDEINGQSLGNNSLFFTVGYRWDF
jgi:tetratricopeptide (TPR) repeat protein